MYRVVRFMRNANKILRIKQIFSSVPDISSTDRIHMVYQYLSAYLHSGYTQITPGVTRYNNVTDALPFGGIVELLIKISVEAKRILADNASKPQLSEPFPECFKLCKI